MPLLPPVTMARFPFSPSSISPPSRVAAILLAGEFRLAAGGEDARLLHPVLALDAALEVERLAHPIDVLVSQHAHGMEPLLAQHADAADALEVVGGAPRAHHVPGRRAPRRLGPGLRHVLIGLRAHRAQ